MATGDRLIMSSKELKRKLILEEILKGRITLKDAAPKMEVCYRQAKRILKRYRKQGDKGLLHMNRGKPPNHAYPDRFKQIVIDLYQEKYLDFGPTFAAEKLLEYDKISVNPETLRLWLLEEKLWCRHRKRKLYRQRRERKQHFGELLQIDGSDHAWFGKDYPRACLLNIVDDATGITLSQMDTGETCQVLLETLQTWIKKYGVPKAVYVDLKNLYVSHHRISGKEEKDTMNTFERVCSKLNITIIKAYSPQAKGRVERNHGVYQDRFVKELKLRNITTIKEANVFLANEYLDKINQKFAKPSSGDAHSPIYGDLNQIFCLENTRQTKNDLTIQYNRQLFQLEKPARSKQTITVRTHLDGSITLWRGEQKLNYQKISAPPIKPETPKKCKHRYPVKNNTPWRRFNPGWLR